jgi:hypothetical protein
MSERSAYLRDQIAKCEFHAKSIGDAETQGELRKLAATLLKRWRSKAKRSSKADSVFGLFRISLTIEI